MSLVRKLQVEVERTLKRIDEGLKDFDDLYDKVAGVDGAAQKQRLEGDLKTEIKKLQKLRDQVKTWAAGPEIKNKQQLTEAREKIERRMEAFKVVERETKTKAYSKEGLARTQALSEEERRKLKAREWVQDAVSKLGDQLDELEGELEALAEAAGRRFGGDVADRQSRTATRKTAVGDQGAGFAQPLGFQIAGRIQQFLHPRAATWTFISNDDDISRLDLVTEDRADSIILTFIDLRDPRKHQDRRIDAGRLNDAAILSDVAIEHR